MTDPHSTPIVVKIADLRPDACGVHLLGQVLGCDVLVERVRADGSAVRVGDVLLGDETGTVNLLARNEQLDGLVVGSCVLLLNARAVLHRGFIRLEIDAGGGIVPSEMRIDRVNTSENVSEIEYVRASS